MAEATGLDYHRDIEFIHDKTDYYLLPSQIWYNKLFTHYTLSSISQEADGETRHTFGLAELGGYVPAARELAEAGWQIGSYVGKIMTSSQAELDAFPAFVKENYDKKSKWTDLRCPDLPLQELLKLVVKHVGFETKLFISQSSSDGSGQLLAGVTNANRQIARRVPEEREESYYGYFATDVEQIDVDKVPSSIWKSLDALHRSFYDQTITAITADALDDCDPSPK